MRVDRQVSGAAASVKQEAMEEAAALALKVHWALEVLDLPDPADPNFEASVVYRAYQLGRLVTKKG